MKKNRDFFWCQESYKNHLEHSKNVITATSRYFAEQGQGCTVSINDNLQIEIQYKIPRADLTKISELRESFMDNVISFAQKNDFILLSSESITYNDYRLKEPYQTFFTEKVILDIDDSFFE